MVATNGYTQHLCTYTLKDTHIRIQNAHADRLQSLNETEPDIYMDDDDGEDGES